MGPAPADVATPVNPSPPPDSPVDSGRNNDLDEPFFDWSTGDWPSEAAPLWPAALLLPAAAAADADAATAAPFRPLPIRPVLAPSTTTGRSVIVADGSLRINTDAARGVATLRVLTSTDNSLVFSAEPTTTTTTTTTLPESPFLADPAGLFGRRINSTTSLRLADEAASSTPSQSGPKVTDWLAQANLKALASWMELAGLESILQDGQGALFSSHSSILKKITTYCCLDCFFFVMEGIHVFY